MQVAAKNFTVLSCALNWGSSVNNGCGRNRYVATVKVKAYDREEHEPHEAKTPLEAFLGALQKALGKLFPCLLQSRLASRSIVLEYDEFRVALDFTMFEGWVCRKAASQDLNEALVKVIVEGFDGAITKASAAVRQCS